MISAVLSRAQFSSARFSARGLDGRGSTGYLYILLATKLPHSPNMVSELNRDNSAWILLVVVFTKASFWKDNSTFVYSVFRALGPFKVISSYLATDCKKN